MLEKGNREETRITGTASLTEILISYSSVTYSHITLLHRLTVVLLDISVTITKLWGDSSCCGVSSIESHSVETLSVELAFSTILSTAREDSRKRKALLSKISRLNTQQAQDPKRD